MKTLQLERKENIKTFNEKINEKDGGYFCKCGKFTSGLRLKALSHALNCGKKVNRNIKSKTVDCLECGNVFKTQRQLDSHFRSVHQVTSYTCSKCHKNFQLKSSYMRHLTHHTVNYTPRLSCVLCEYKTDSLWHFNRHVGRNHMASVVSEAIMELLSESALHHKHGAAATFSDQNLEAESDHQPESTESHALPDHDNSEVVSDHPMSAVLSHQPPS